MPLARRGVLECLLVVWWKCVDSFQGPPNLPRRADPYKIAPPNPSADLRSSRPSLENRSLSRLGAVHFFVKKAALASAPCTPDRSRLGAVHFFFKNGALA